MKTLILLACVLGLNSTLLAQSKDITVFEKKDGDKNIVIARNTGKVPYLVTLDIHATGMDVDPGLKVEGVVPAGSMLNLATLTPKPEETWTYGYNVSYIEYTEDTPVSSASGSTEPSKTDEVPVPMTNITAKTDVSNNDIIVYSKPGCSRCAFVKKSLLQKGIKFKEVDVTSGDPEVNNMWMDLRHGGFSGESVTMPVVKVEGQLHYNIRDLQQFVDGIKM